MLLLWIIIKYLFFFFYQAMHHGEQHGVGPADASTLGGGAGRGADHQGTQPEPGRMHGQPVPGIHLRPSQQGRRWRHRIYIRHRMWHGREGRLLLDSRTFRGFFKDNPKFGPIRNYFNAKPNNYQECPQLFIHTLEKVVRAICFLSTTPNQI